MKIQSALISVYHKNGLNEVLELLTQLGVKIYSTGGTYDHIQQLGFEAVAVEEVTDYPSILGGRVKTLHPKIFGGILARRDNSSDLDQLIEYEIPTIDLVIVDLYPFEQTVRETKDENEIIEKIDIGGISLIRAAAKNFHHTLVIASQEDYDPLIQILKEKNGEIDTETRLHFAARAFHISSHYDSAIFNYFMRNEEPKAFKQSVFPAKKLRYGENPHQQGFFFGSLDEIFDQLNGKEISYNNLVDVDSAINLIDEFEKPTFVVIKHTNACGVASREKLSDAWKDALAGDPVSAFGGVIGTNKKIDPATAEELNKLFFEIIIAPDFEENALTVLKSKKNRIILKRKSSNKQINQFKSILNGVISQDADLKTETAGDLKCVTTKQPSPNEMNDLLFALKCVKHLKSNTITLVKNEQLLSMGCGQTSRVDALKQAITKAKDFGFDLHGSVMSSDAFFPFPDCVEIAHQAGVTAVVEPGGSLKDQDSIDVCNKNGMVMMFTGMRHFKH